jgi:hypothetical protein
MGADDDDGVNVAVIVAVGVRDAVGDVPGRFVGVIVGGVVGVDVSVGWDSCVASKVAALLLASIVDATEVAMTLSFASIVAATDVAMTRSLVSGVNAAGVAIEVAVGLLGASGCGCGLSVSKLLHAEMTRSRVALIRSTFFFMAIFLLWKLVVTSM